MQTVDLKLDVPVGYSLEEFVAKVNVYVARLASKRKEKEVQKAKLNAVIALGGAFAASNTDDWKKEKAEYLDDKYGV